MRAVVVEIKGKYAVVLNKKGQFVKIRNNGRLAVGHEVDAAPVSGFELNSYARIASMAAVFLLSVSLGFGAYAYKMPYSYVDVDINPSVELVANRFDRIIDAKGLNSEGEKLLASVKYKNKDIQAGIDGILQSARDEGYLKEDVENAVLLTVSGNNSDKVEKIEEKIRTNTSEELKTIQPNTQVLTEKVTLESRDEAISQGISPGRLLLIEKYRQVQPESKTEDLVKTPVRELVKTINENRKDRQADLKEEKKEEREDKKQEKNNEKEKQSDRNDKNTNSEKEVKESAKPASAESKQSEGEKRQESENVKKNSSKDGKDENTDGKAGEKDKDRNNENDKRIKRN